MSRDLPSPNSPPEIDAGLIDGFVEQHGFAVERDGETHQVIKVEDFRELFLPFAAAGRELVERKAGADETCEYMDGMGSVVDAAREMGMVVAPPAHWRARGEADPHGKRYDGDRAELLLSHMTDDELANGVYLDPNVMTLTAAKERIRWLSRRVVRLEADMTAPSLPDDAVLEQAIEGAIRKVINCPDLKSGFMSLKAELLAELKEAVTANQAADPSPSSPS